MATVDLVGLRKSYGSADILHGINLSVHQGEFMALVGPSGCGKSTLLRMIAGLETVTAGEVRFDGRAVNQVDPKHRNVAMVFQNYALYPHMTVRENMALNLKISRMPRQEIRRRVDEAAALLEVTPILDRRPSQLSGGQRQRVAMGRAIVRDPAVFLFDEPLSNLDAKLRVQMRAEIKSLHQKVRTTAIYVTHDQIEAMTLADRIAVMNAGRIEQLGTPIELYRSPVNRFVAGFIGSPAMNFLAGRVDGGRVQLAGTDVALALAGRLGLAESTPVEVGLRPEHLRPAEQGLSGTVAQVEPTGSQTHLLVDFAGRTLVTVLEGMVPLAPGDPITLAIRPENVHVFAEGGEVVEKHYDREADMTGLSVAERLKLLEPPRRKVRAVLDTDTYNEIDDQFAIVQMLLSPESIDVQAIYAAPFHNRRSDGPGHGMELSYEEILRLLERMGRKPDGFVHRGVTAYVGAEKRPVAAPAVDDLIERARAGIPDNPLYVVAIGAISNVASALLKAPEIIDRVVVVWLGGHALEWPDTREFNLKQDVGGAQVLFDCGVPVVLLPCMGVVSHLHSTVPEIERHVEPFGEIGRFLAQRYKEYSDNHEGWSKEIWDMAPVAWLIDSDWCPSVLIPTPILTEVPTWSFDAARPLMRYVRWVDRDPILRDFFTKLRLFGRQSSSAASL